MQDFTFFLGALSTTKPARHIRFADSLDNLATRLLRFANALYDQATFPTTLRPHCSSLLGKSASPNASDLDIWTAVTQLVVASDSSKAPSAPRTPQTPQTPSPPPPPPPPPPPKDYSTECERRNAVLVKLCENWTNDYLPDSLEALRQMIRDNESRTDLPKLFYAKTLIFVQSSGMGKSRLADAFGQECPMVNFVLREKESLGYPPADREVLLFMRKGLQSMAAELPRSEEVMKRSRILETEDEIFLESMVTTAWNHSIAVGLLQASFEICKLRPLFITAKAQVLIQNVRHSQCVGQTAKFGAKPKGPGSHPTWDDGTIQTQTRKLRGLEFQVKLAHRFLSLGGLPR
jgi:hypothetical protein